MATKKKDKDPEDGGGGHGVEEGSKAAKKASKGAKKEAKAKPDTKAHKYRMAPPPRTKSMGVVGRDGAVYRLEAKDGVMEVPSPAMAAALKAGCTRLK